MVVNVTFTQSVNVVVGQGEVSKVGEIATLTGAKSKVLIVTDKGVIGAGIVDKVIEGLKSSGLPYAIFDKVMPDPLDTMIHEGAEFCMTEGCDLVVAVGGGSAIDAAKGINALRYGEGSIMDLYKTSIGHCPGLVCVPTTSGTGSELSNAIVVTNAATGTKRLMLSPAYVADYAILDPELTVGMPPQLTASTGLDVLAHATESFTTNFLSNPLSQAISEKAAQLVVKWLPTAVADGENIEARQNMAVASMMGGWCLLLAAAHAGHSFAHMLGSNYHIPHGLACSYANPFIIEWNALVVPENMKRVGEILGASFSGNETPAEIGAITRDAYIAFYKSVGIKPISQYNCDLSILPKVADDILTDPAFPLNPREMSKDDIIELLKKIMAQG